MSENKGPYYITTAIAYTSGKPHIGNVYEIVLADSIARYKRLVGYDVRFQTGTDEHGQKVEEKATKAGVSPKAFVDEVSKEIKNQFVKSFLYYVPYVTLAVMTFPTILYSTQTPASGGLALAAGTLLAWNGASLFKVSAACCIVVFLSEMILI